MNETRTGHSPAHNANAGLLFPQLASAPNIMAPKHSSCHTPCLRLRLGARVSTGRRLRAWHSCHPHAELRCLIQTCSRLRMSYVARHQRAACRHPQWLRWRQYCSCAEISTMLCAHMWCSLATCNVLIGLPW